jgi:uncharacterized protein YkwD
MVAQLLFAWQHVTVSTPLAIEARAVQSLFVNHVRAAAGLPALPWDERLAEVALRQVKAMAVRDTVFHNPHLMEEVDYAGLAWRGLAENVGKGEQRATITSAFLASPSHRKNILGNYTAFGEAIAVDSRGHVWTSEVFIRECR